MSDPHFTKVQHRILALLSDGQGHTKQEIHDCLHDHLAEMSAVRYQIHRINKVLRPRGEEVICQYNGMGSKYRHIRLLASSSNGKR